MAVSAKEFVLAWQSSTSVADCAEKLNQSPSYVYARGKDLAHRGVKLKKLPTKGRRKVNVAELNALIEATSHKGDDDVETAG